MAEFLHENNSCGHNILCLVSRGNAIISEILRLKEYVPPIYRLETKSDVQKYGQLLPDLSFFKQIDEFEKKLDADENLQDLDDEIRDNHLETVTRFYLLFESILKYIKDLNRFVQDLDDGLYIQQTIETVFGPEEGKQLMCEALYLCGVMLLMVDFHIPGVIRERFLVSYFRYSAQRGSDCYVDEVCKLLASTGFSSSSRRPQDYPEGYFKRAGINDFYVRIVVGRLRADDIYHQLKVFPLPEQRSTALATQAAMLFVCLYFQPSILHGETTAMREIVDKYFPDNWVVSLYMGEIVNLSWAWEPFKAAKTALANTLETANVEKSANRAKDQLMKLLPKVEKLNIDRLTEEQILDKSQKIVELVREANVTLRWLLLHTAPLTLGMEHDKKSRQLRDLVLGGTKHCPQTLFTMLLNTAEFELHVREMIKSMLLGKGEKWKKDKQECVDRILELADVFSGSKPLSRLEKNEKLEAWFRKIAQQIESLDYEKATETGRKITQLILALEEVQEFHGISSHGQARQVLDETRTILHGLLRSAGLQEETSIQLQVIGDMSYAWTLLGNYAKFMQEGIKRDTGLVVKLRATILKMASALEVPLLRINQARSPDLVSVSQYYSSELVALLRRVLHIIPETMFQIMAQIATLRTDSIKEIPTRLDKDELREYAQLDQRYQVAKLTNDVSMLTEGVSLLKSTLVGVIRIDPIQLLEDGIRCELVRHVALALDKGLSFNHKNKDSDLEVKLERLGDIMEGQKRSFEYIQDYIHIYGLKIWQEELSRVIGYYVEQECNTFLRNKVSESQSIYQSKAIPIPNFSPVDNQSANCIGRLVREILRITDPRNTIHLENSMTWVDWKDKHEVLGLRFFNKMSRAVGIPGLAGVDRLLSFMIATELQGLIANWQKLAAREKDVQAILSDAAKQMATATIISNSVKVYSAMMSKSGKLVQSLLEPVLKIGQMQLLRIHISYELSSSCQFESPHLANALEAFNKAMLWDVKKYYRDENSPHPSEDLLHSLAAQLDNVGLSDPARKIYVTARNVRYFPLISFLFTLCNIAKIIFPDASGAVPAKKSDVFDGSSFTMGLHTLMWQFHPEARGQYLTYMGQFVKSRVADPNKAKLAGLEETVTVRFLETIIKYAKLPKSTLSAYIPFAVLDVL